MIQINARNVKSYLLQVLPLALSCDKEDLNILKTEEVTEQTYVNYIFRAEISKKGKKTILYLRQSRDHIKASPDKKADPTRIAYEVNILNLICDLVKDVVPKVIYLDNKNNTAILSDIRRGAPLLVNELIKGEAHPETGKYFGEIIAEIHGQTIGISNSIVRGSEKKNQEARDFHLGMRLDPAKDMFSKEVKDLLRNSAKGQECLVLGDLASKNIFIDQNKVRFLDLERSFIGDPAFDLGFLFCHYLVEIKPEKRGESLKFIENFIENYQVKMLEYTTKDEVNKIINRAIRFLGVTILYRLFGFYMVVNIKRRKEYWINIARNLLQNQDCFSFRDSVKKFIKNY